MIEYVEVICKFDVKGEILPLYIQWHNGIKYPIDRIIQRCPAASLKGGGAGMRYTCLISNQRRYLFLNNNRWFIEKGA